jgi:hypothetical protein
MMLCGWHLFPNKSIQPPRKISSMYQPLCYIRHRLGEIWEDSLWNIAVQGRRVPSEETEG